MPGKFIWQVARWLVMFAFLYMIALGWRLLSTEWIHHPTIPHHPPLQLPIYECPNTAGGGEVFHDQHPTRPAPSQVHSRILLIADPTSTASTSALYSLLTYLKVPIRVEPLPNQPLLLEVAGTGRFSLIIFADYRTYHSLPSAHKIQLLAYCSHNHVGIISFLIGGGGGAGSEEESFNGQFVAIAQKRPKRLHFPFDSPIAKVAKRGATLPYVYEEDWVLLTPTTKNAHSLLDADDQYDVKRSAALLLREDGGVDHIVVGQSVNKHWLMRLLLHDTLTYLAPNLLNGDEMERYIQIDIDDIFVAQSGNRLTPADVKALIELQRELADQHIEGFRFSLGFSGYFFRHSEDAVEVAGDEALIANAHHFDWFPHMWRHNHAHEYTETYLLALMEQNKIFAKNTKLPVSLHYAISPQHSGVYPFHQALYNAWRSVWNVSVTSTEEYPHLKPPSSRRGFEHAGVSVLPRQTCGLFTHTSFFHAYPEGWRILRDSALGGDLFTTLLMNRFSIFMTHQQNFANDHLGAYLFRNAVRFLSCWTNLKLVHTTPSELAQRYFTRFPSERTLLYTDPCADKRHRRMLPVNETCDGKAMLPNLIILGPQKTGTSALSLFLSLHSSRVATNIPISGSFEELQFFGGKNYPRGLDWYQEKFAHIPINTSPTIIAYEKSANYFDSEGAPRALHALIPNAKVAVILMDPVDRAYSWFQHILAHNYTSAMAEEVFLGNSTEHTQLRRRCLQPGLYASHLDRWLDFFPPSQLIIIDGQRLREEPIPVMEELFDQLGIDALPDLHQRIKFVGSKGFHCAVSDNGHLHCLGASKGRKYAPMSAALRSYLSTYYSEHNRALHRWLTTYHFKVPAFLQRQFPGE